ncbi:hypothetical protein [Deinococcus pimensis]|uniref:hypothetical protein n=1 Tax=Deinococcus pimensis TaxID=309888 RepID=UPI0005EBAE9A|nr:hypothetical protein [Deinococcus pimensis]
MIRSIAIVLTTTGIASAIGIQVGGNLPTSLSSLEVEFPLGSHDAVGVGVGVLVLPTEYVSTFLPAANVYYRSFLGTPEGGMFLGGRLGTNIWLTTGTATAGYRLNLGHVYLDGEVGIGATTASFREVYPAISVGVNIGVRF